jgi:SAM-dependent methyltransferase
MAAPLHATYDITLPAPLDRAPSEPFPRRLRHMLRRLADRYPEGLRAGQLQDVERVAFHVEQILRPGASLADLGGGIGLFPTACAALGMRTFLVDDFDDEVNHEYPLASLDVHREVGVHVVQSDVRHWSERFDDESLDVVTSFDSLEHWHHSPRGVFQEAFRTLKPGGRLFLGAPNAVNLRKRIAVPLGRSNWSHFEDWYYPDQFRGHVREPVLGDLLRMVRELGFETETVWGRNWSGYLGGRMRRWTTCVVDRVLRLRPTLCSDLYVLAVKPG